jgi:DNA polymerase (family 10)
LLELGRRTALAGNNYFQSRAYLRAADSPSALPEPLMRVIKENRLRQVPGIGKTIADIVTKLHRTGTHPLLDKLRRDVPQGVLDMLSVPGLKPDKINILHKELGITDLDELAAAAREDRLRTIKGLGAAFQRKIMQGLKIRDEAQRARHIHRAAELVSTAIETQEQADPELAHIVVAGGIRRGGELVSDLAVVAELKQLEGPLRTVTSGDLAVYLTDAERVDISLLRATGSREHLASAARGGARDGPDTRGASQGRQNHRGRNGEVDPENETVG